LEGEPWRERRPIIHVGAPPRIVRSSCFVSQAPNHPQRSNEIPRTLTMGARGGCYATTGI